MATTNGEIFKLQNFIEGARTAHVAEQVFVYPAYEGSSYGVLSGVPVFTLPKATTFKMRGEDHNTNGLYDTWQVVGQPDLTGAQYTGSLATPLRDIIIDSEG